MALQTTALVRQGLSSDHVDTQQARTQQLHCNRGMLFSVWTVPRCCKQDKLGTGVS
jgi:hypothetical protein